MFFARSSAFRFTPPALAVWMVVFLLSSPIGLKAEDPAFVAVAKSYLDRGLKALSTYLQESPPEEKKSDPDEIARRAELDDSIRQIFLVEKGYHFTQSRWGAQPVPYQIDELTTIELPGSSLNSGDYNSGIDRRVTYEFEAKAFRLYDEVGGWGKWQKGKPPHLEGITLVRQNGSWKVSVSPTSIYSVK